MQQVTQTSMTTTALSSPVFSSFTSAHFRPRAECPLVLFSGGGRGGGQETGRKGGGRCMGGGRRGSRKQEKKGKITQDCKIICNQKNAKRREPTNTGWELGLKGMESTSFRPPPAPAHFSQNRTRSAQCGAHTGPIHRINLCQTDVVVKIWF